MQLIEWIRRRRRERTRVLFIAQTMGELPETAALTWMTRLALFGSTATLLQIAGVIRRRQRQSKRQVQCRYTAGQLQL